MFEISVSYGRGVGAVHGDKGEKHSFQGIRARCDWDLIDNALVPGPIGEYSFDWVTAGQHQEVNVGFLLYFK